MEGARGPFLSYPPVQVSMGGTATRPLFLEAPLVHGQDKILYKEMFLSAHLGALSQHFSLWARK